MTSPDQLSHEVARRRTFAIISHPDAGKTTMTEKLLLYGGAIHMAGTIKARKGGRSTTSDWMAIEKERGISITTSVLQFEYGGRRLNLLDTPGHNDFSEDTYRTLAAADTAVMVVDNVKGVEPQTIKLFQVCRMRGIPIVTFINKMDRLGRDPLDLMDEIERVLEIPCWPANWPIGSGPDFQGVFDRMGGKLLTFERMPGGQRAPVQSWDRDDPAARESIGERAFTTLTEELELQDAAGNAFDPEAFRRGEVTPVFFGSAITSFGVEPFLDRFVDLAPAPAPRITSGGGKRAPDAAPFSGFVFKIQANMDPNHRDRIAFVRICSGKFVRGMDVQHARTSRNITLARSLQFMAQERVTVDEAFSGDIVGLWDPGVLRIGDSLGQDPVVEYAGIPRFSPEHFARVRLADPMKRKQLKKGLDQLSEEGAVQMFFDRQRLGRDPVLGAVGVLQFEVTVHRLETEYGVKAILDRLPYRFARWVETAAGAAAPDLGRFERSGRSTCLLDVEDRPLVLFADQWALRTAEEQLSEGVTFIAAVQPGRRAHAG